MAPDAKHRLRRVTSTSRITLWGVGPLAGWPMLGGFLPLALIFLLNSRTDPAESSDSGVMDLMQPRLIPLFALLFFGVFSPWRSMGSRKAGLKMSGEAGW